jgi:hypothetical protein
VALAAYRWTGADLPFGDPLPAHGVGLEGYYWRITDPAAGRVVFALCGVAAGPDGPWATVALAAHPDGVLRTALTRTATADPARLGVTADAVLAGDAERLRVDLGPGARLDVAFDERRPWPRRAFGGLGPAQVAPGLPQYWHPHLLGARVRGTAELGEAAVDLTGAGAYAEKNWGAAFAGHWWWGQAQGFTDPRVCVAFAGGRVRRAGVAAAPTALVVATPGELVRLGPPFAHTVTAARAGSWRVRARSARHRVEIEGEAEPAGMLALPVPVPGRRAVEPRSRQAAAGRMTVEVRRGRRLLLREESALAGLEFGVAT